MWDIIRALAGEGVTVLLTTQYLDEADALANRIVVVDHGEVIAGGTPQELKEASRSAHVEVMLAVPHAGAAGAWPMRHPVQAALIWSVVIPAVAAPAATHFFKRRTTE